jgi:hypothetical protein
MESFIMSSSDSKANVRIKALYYFFNRNKMADAIGKRQPSYRRWLENTQSIATPDLSEPKRQERAT